MVSLWQKMICVSKQQCTTLATNCRTPFFKNIDEVSLLAVFFRPSDVFERVFDENSSTVHDYLIWLSFGCIMSVVYTMRLRWMRNKLCSVNMLK